MRILLYFIKSVFECLLELCGRDTNNKKGQFNTKIKSAYKDCAKIL